MSVPSPCVSICQMNEQTGWCNGCLRTLDEVAIWPCLADDEKRSILQTIETRKQAIGAGGSA